MFFIRYLLQFLWLCLIAALPLAAQSQNFRISHDSPHTPQLPDSARIQSAATLGARTFVVWGTSAFSQDGNIVHALHTRMLNDSAAISTQAIVGGSAAYPSHVVRVLALADKFIVLWKDIRPTAPGLYAQRFTLDGDAIGAAQLVDGGDVVPDAIGIFGKPDRGYAIMWNMRAGSTLKASYRRLAPDGDFASTLVRFGTRGEFTDALPSIPGMQPVQLADGRGICFRDDGTMDQRTFNAALLDQGVYQTAHPARRFYINADTSMAVLADGELRLHGNLFIAQPWRRVTLPKIEGSLDNSWFVSRDSTGRYAVYYARLVPVDTLNFKLYVHRIDIEDDGAHAPVLIDSLAGKSIRIAYEVKPDTFSIHCDNARYYTFRYDYWTLDFSKDVPTYHMGKYAIGTTSTGRYIGRTTMQGIPQAPVCPGLKAPRIDRSPAIDSSRITVRLAAGNVALAAPTAYLIPNYPDRKPAVAIARTGPLVAWQVMRPDGTMRFYARKWYVADANDLRDVRESIPDTLSSAPRDNDPTYWSQEAYSLQSQGTFITLSQPLVRRFVQTRGDTATLYWGYRLWMKGYVGTDWLHLRMFGVLEKDSDGFGLPVAVTGMKADNSELISAIGIPTPTDSTAIFSMTAFDVDWQEKWSMNAGTSRLPPPRYILPIGYEECVMICGRQWLQFKSGAVINTVDFPAPGLVEYFHSLADGSVLRVSTVDPEKRRFDVERYSSDGDLLRHRELQFSTPAEGISIAEMLEPDENRIVILRGSSAGLHAAFLDAGLILLGTDLHVNESTAPARNPSAQFSRRELFMAWEEYRDGESDIYGGIWNPPIVYIDGVPRDNDMPGAGIVIESIAPVPAHDRAHVDFRSDRAGEVTLELYDVLGRPALPARSHACIPGSNRIDLDLDGLASCMYTVVLASPDGSKTVGRMVVTE